MVTVGALTGFTFSRAGAKAPVVVMVRTVPAGHVITRADLSTVALAGALTTIAARDLSAVVGRRVKVTALAGTPLQRSMLSTAADLQEDQAQVGLAVAAGQIPADGVQAGDTVEVLRLPGTDSGEAPSDPAQILVEAASVWSAQPDPAHPGGMLLTVTVPSETVGATVSASGAGQVAVVRVATGS
jgi:hypothetical protein